MSAELRCLSIHQPWASALALGIKRFETRSWQTRYRCPLAIHATTHWTDVENYDRWRFVEKLRKFGHPSVEQLGLNLPLGCIVAVGDLTACWPTGEMFFELDEVELMLGDFSPGRFAWRFSDMVQLPEPVPCRGQQGLWIPAREIADVVVTQTEGMAS